MLDQYQIDDVLEEEQPSLAPAPARIATKRANRETGDNGQQILSAALAFEAEIDSRYHEWSESVFIECLQRHQQFSDVTTTQPTVGEWQTLFNGVQMALLCGDTEQNRLDRMASWVEGSGNTDARAVAALLAFFGHQPQRAIDNYRLACDMSTADASGSGGSKRALGQIKPGLSAVAYGLSLLQLKTQNISSAGTGSLTATESKQLESLVEDLNALANEYQSQFPGNLFTPVLRVLTDFARVVCGQREISQTIWLGGLHIDASPWLDLFLNLSRHWLGEKPDELLVARLAGHVERASEAGLHWFVDEGLTLLSAQGLHRDTSEFQPQIRSTGRLLNIYQKQSDWQSGLDALTLAANRHTRIADRTAPGVDDRRMCWWLSASDLTLHVEPREQRLGRNGKWSRGKRFPLKLLLDECGTLDFLCDLDLKICAHLRNQLQLDHALYFEKRFAFTTAESLELIMHHPRLYRDDPDPSLDIDAEEPLPVTISRCTSTLQVVNDKTLQEISIAMDPFPPSAIKSSGDFFCQWQQQNVLSVQCFTEGQLDLARSLSYSGLKVPADASDAVLQSLRSMAALVEIHTDINTVDSSTVAAQRRLAFHLRPLETGIDLSVCIYPLGEHGPCVMPGQGKPGLYAMIGNRPCNTTRDLNAELVESREILNQLPLPNASAGWQWSIDDAEQALEVLSVLQEMEDKVTLMWPAGERIALSTVIDSDSMHVHFNSQRNGIGVAGELKVEKGQHAGSGSYDLLPLDANAFANTRIDLKKLLASLDKADGRFLRLDDGKILQLSRRLRMQLEAFKALCDDGSADHLAVPMLEQASRGMVLQDDDNWQQQLDRLREAEALMPEPPETLQAQLRDYQLEGFRWMVRLAHWGAGACLADDMGLGKTMQSLALMLLRAAGGPTLVVAPTSVCGNWLAEAERFAPSLRLRWLGEGNRSRMLREAGPGDLFVCSYGVLQNEIEMLQEIEWHTIVADEAQSFKNAGTRRSQAMMSLRGDFRMIATGTPIENHLGELWNLFRFINPGLLGSSQQFKERYAHPIEHGENDAARERLKTLIRPFILRRLKREVLTELPERTEITHLVEFNDAEKDFYEGLRKQALQRISELSELDSEQRFRVLAEITSLRQASCHPALVTDTPPCGSAKLRAFAEIVDELLCNGHRCLVFSQFVGHLTLIREHLDAQRIKYQYLDGSTNVKKRKQAVDDFQAGEGELFLISLKAGGSGLNLTAADYVIHMDPWWNPAVEDQASDRAYRMGQKRPVTIYRMVVKDTIEEKIVKLHEQKRDLANALLEGTDSGSRLSVEQLVELIDDESAEDTE
ncbi:hypothetical protein AB833_13175 [Chromatiales bacterium (ex Bugula neritina AB1)]|nr:hypothetical protein AB833_13175 [Chromatiales bacterium (ex Bugula neritina AB1)]